MNIKADKVYYIGRYIHETTLYKIKVGIQHARRA